MGVGLPGDLRTFIEMTSPVIFDVGANIGQSVQRFCEIWESPTITSFEPDPRSADTLEARYSGLAGHSLVRSALGSEENDSLTLYRYPQSDLNSVNLRRSDAFFNEPPVEQIPVPQTTLDAYCTSVGVTTIDLLKIDVEGAEQAVVEGARTVLSAGMVGYVLIEVAFGRLYAEVSKPLELFGLMDRLGFEFVGIYHQAVRNHRLCWADVLWGYGDTIR